MSKTCTAPNEARAYLTRIELCRRWGISRATSYRYERGKDFAMITFKNDEVDSKDTNLSP